MTRARHYWPPDLCEWVARQAAAYCRLRAQGERLALTQPLAARRAYAEANRIAQELRAIADAASHPY